MVNYIKFGIGALLCAVLCVASYYAGYHNNNSKHYEAACLQADFIHYMMDIDSECWNLGAEIEKSYYEWFQDLNMGIYGTKHLKSINDLEKYYWCY